MNSAGRSYTIPSPATEPVPWHRLWEKMGWTPGGDPTQLRREDQAPPAAQRQLGLPTEPMGPMGERRTRQKHLSESLGQRADRRARRVLSVKKNLRFTTAARRIGPLGIALVVLLPVTAALTAMALNTPVPEVLAAPAASSAITEAPTLEPISLVVLGDSYTGGSDENTGPEWPTMLASDNGWTVYTDAVGGSGYVTDGQGQRFGSRIAGLAAKYRTDYVVVAGGMNDLDYPVSEVIDAARSDLKALDRATDAKIVVFSPFSHGTPGTENRALTSALKDLTRSLGYHYIDVSGFLPDRPGLIGKDGVHPTDAGHHLLEKRIASALSKALGQPART